MSIEVTDWDPFTLNKASNSSFELKNLGFVFEKLSKTAIVPTDSIID